MRRVIAWELVNNMYIHYSFKLKILKRVISFGIKMYP